MECKIGFERGNFSNGKYGRCYLHNDKVRSCKGKDYFVDWINSLDDVAVMRMKNIIHKGTGWIGVIGDKNYHSPEERQEVVNKFLETSDGQTEFSFALIYIGENKYNIDGSDFLRLVS